MFDRLKRDDHVNRPIRKRDRLGIAGTSIDPILPTGVLANIVGDIDSHHARCPGLGERRRSITLTAGDVEHSLAAYEVLCEAVARDVLPEDPAVRFLGHHALGVMCRTIVASHASHSRSGLEILGSSERTSAPHSK